MDIFTQVVKCELIKLSTRLHESKAYKVDEENMHIIHNFIINYFFHAFVSRKRKALVFRRK